MANENVIPAGLPGYVMRKRIEDKATLHKGGMYVGTGEYETITDKKGNEYKVYKTEELPVGKEGQVLMSTVDGIKWENPQNVVLNAVSSSVAQQADESFLSQTKWETGIDSLITQLNKTPTLRNYYLMQIQVVNNTNDIYDLGFLVLLPRVFSAAPLQYDTTSDFYYQTIEVNSLIFELQGVVVDASDSSTIKVEIKKGYIKEHENNQINNVTDNYTIKWRECR